MEEHFITRLVLLFSVSCFISFWCWFIVRPLRPSVHRFVTAFPVFVFTLIPATLFIKDSRNESILYYYCVTNYLWLLNLKLTALVLDRGPLVAFFHRPLLFSWVLLFPINVEAHNGKVKHRLNPDEAQKVFLIMLAKILGCIGFARGVHLFWDFGAIRDFCLSWLMYCLLTAVMECVSYISLIVLGIQLTPHFDRPWLSTSISEFWSMRWNLVVGALLRDLIYDPILEGSLARSSGARAKPLRQMIGVLCTFLGSGIMHWLVIYYIVRISAWMNAISFCIHGGIVVIERCFFIWIYQYPKLMRYWNQIPWLVKAFCAQFVLHFVAHKFFWAELAHCNEAKQLVRTLDVLNWN
eukprot:g6480.t1